MGSNKPETKSTRVVLPEPLFPIIQIQSFFFIFKLKFSIIFLSEFGYLYSIFFNSISFSNLKFSLVLVA